MDWAELDATIAQIKESVTRWRANNPRSEAENHAQPEFARLLDSIYAQPDMEHESGWLRLLHADLEDMDKTEVRAERARLRMRLMIDPEPDGWFMERLQALGAVHAD